MFWGLLSLCVSAGLKGERVGDLPDAFREALGLTPLPPLAVGLGHC